MVFPVFVEIFSVVFSKFFILNVVLYFLLFVYTAQPHHLVPERERERLSFIHQTILYWHITRDITYKFKNYCVRTD